MPWVRGGVRMSINTNVVDPAATRTRPGGARGRVAAAVGRLFAGEASWRPIVWQAAAMWLVTRIAYVAFTYFALVLNLDPTTSTFRQVPVATLLQSWQHFDANWYLGIAADGYRSPQPTAFFPLYPALIHAATWIVGAQNALPAAMVIANLGTLGAFIAIALLAAGESQTAVAGWVAVRVFAAYPLAFFLTAPYTEGIFVAFAAATLFSARRAAWRWAAAFAFLAALTRPTGLALILPLFYEYGRRHDWWRRETWQALQTSGGRRDLRARLTRVTPATLADLTLAVGAVPAAIAAYSAYCFWRFRNPVMWVSVQGSFWGHRRIPIWVTLWHGTLNVLTPGVTDAQARAAINLIPVLAFAVITLVAVRRSPLMLTLYTLGVIYLSLASPVVTNGSYVTSDGRYMIAAVPVFLILAQWSERRPWLDLLLVSGGFLVQAMLALVFLHNGYIN